MLALLGVLPMANLVTTGGGLPWWSSAVQQWAAWGALVAAVALALAASLGDRVDTLAERVTKAILAPTSRAFAAIAFVAAMLLALYLGWRLFGFEPATIDEFSQRWHAELIAHGRLFAHAEPNTEFFATIEALDIDGRWFSQFPIGWPAILAIGVKVGMPWAINPLLAGICAIAVYEFSRTAADELTSRVTALLFVTSPFVMFMAGSQMNHTASQAFLWVALAALTRWTRASDGVDAMRWAALVGLGVGLAATIRPFDALIVAVAIALFQVGGTMRERWRVRTIVVQCAVALVPVVLVLLANRATTGVVLPFAYDVLNGPEHRPGFHATPPGFEHTPRRGLYIVSAYLMKLDVGLLGWPVPAILLVVASLVLMRRTTRWDLLMLTIVAGVLAGYFTYWSESYFLGPRFLLTIAPILLLYTARFPSVVRERIAAPVLRRAVALLVPLWMLVAALAPAKDGRLYGVQELARLYTSRSQPGPRITEAVSRAGITKALIFLDDGWHARLAARLRAFGMRPLRAEHVVTEQDACILQLNLDAAEQLPESVPLGARANVVMEGVARSDGAAQLPGLAPNEQLSLAPNNPLAPVCRRELERSRAMGVSLAEMLRYQRLDASGALTGVVYARNFGDRNERLRSRFGDRAWYVARVSRSPGAPAVQLEPYR